MRNCLLLVWTIAVSHLSCVSAVGEAIDCQDTAHGRSCSLHVPPEITSLVRGRLFVGLVDELLAFDADDLRLVDRADISAPDRISSCKNDNPTLDDPTVECRNYPRVLQPVRSDNDSSDEILVCGTNSYFPQCTRRTRTDLSDWTYLTGNPQHSDSAFSPYSSTKQIVSVLASNGRFFSAFPSRYINKLFIKMVPRPLQGYNEFTVSTPRSDPIWLNKPNMVSTYEVGDYIYFFLTEPAYEVNFGKEVKYSRAIRVCKNDEGFVSPTGDRLFHTFQKVRMTCSNSLYNSNAPTYDFDNLKSTYLWTDPETSEQILYAAFSSPENGPPGAALCRFVFDESEATSLMQVFNSNEYLIYDTGLQPPDWRPVPLTKFTCNNYATTRNTSHLLVNEVASSDAFHVITGEDQEFTHIATTRLDLGGSSSSVDIIYYSLVNGEVGQVVLQPQSLEIYARTITNVGRPVRHLETYKSPNGVHHLYVVTESDVMTIDRGACSAYPNCFSCFDSKDPYCIWDRSSGLCVSRGSSADFIELYSSNETDIVSNCGSRPPPTPEPPSTSSPTPTTRTVSPVTDGRGSNGGGASFSLVELIGATLGGVGGGILVGIVICAVFFRLFAKKRKSIGSDHYTQRQGDLERGPATVNNQLHVTAHSKEQMLHTNEYAGLPGMVNQRHLPPEKNVNQFVGDADDDDDDVLTDLPSSSNFHISNGGGTHMRLQPPRVAPKPYASSGSVPRGRTDSTRWLRASESSEQSDSPSPGLSPEEFSPH